ncbi:M20/M25/M40 family metallo-hydrolase [Nocardia sp. NPDC049149]|uniref:M20/M25/M40 family metallo-hydrolase n=1 Tax=Nocardia sp. NPDC049149 TaxID=3364315 RepID=UPI003710CAA2
MISSTTLFADQLHRLLSDDELIRLAADLTAIPSSTGQETALACHVRNMLRRNDIRAYYQEVEPGRLQTIARLGPERGKPALLLGGHLDTAPFDRQPPRESFTARRDGDRLYGTGLPKMKGGLAAILGATIMLRRSGIPMLRPLLLQFVVGGLQDDLGARHALRSGLTAKTTVVPSLTPCGSTTGAEPHILISEMRACADSLALLAERHCC